MQRLFVALEVARPLRQAIRKLQYGLRGARWLDEDDLHLTLAFIGEVDGSAQRRIETALGDVTTPSFRMELHGLGHYPPRGVPRVLWTGASPKVELGALAQAVRRALGRAGLILERRRFSPHVTIARFRRPPSRAGLERYLGTCSLFRTAPADVTSFHLFSSVLRPAGARYTMEAAFPLTGAPPGGRDPG